MARLKLIGKVWYSDIRFPAGKDLKTGKTKYKRVQRPLSTVHKIAEGKLADLIKKRNAHKHGHNVQDESYEAAKERFLKIYASKSKVTRRHYVRAIRNLEAAVPVTDLPQITPELLVDVYLRWKAEGRGLYARNRDVECLLAFVRRAEAWGAVPARDWDAAVQIMDREPRGRVDFFTPEEVGKLLANTWGMWRTMAMLGARAGLRPGEMYFLEWTDLELERRKLHVDSKPRMGFNVKTYERRTIPMPADLLAYLLALSKKKKGPFVLMNEDGDRPGSTDVMSTYFSRRVRAAGLKGHLYKLRHTFGSHLAQAGRRLEEIRDLMGHKTVQTTEIYAHLLPHAHVEAINSLPTVVIPKN